MEKNRVYGGRCGELLATFDHESSSWKTLQMSFEWAEPMLLDHLPKSGITVNGRLYPLNNSELHPCESVGFVLDIPNQCLTVDGLLPTPTATGTQRRARYSQGGRPLFHMLLKALPTPTASTNYEPSKEGCWKRQKVCGYILGVEIAKTMGVTMEEAIGKQLRVHPHFVEWMMGYPIGWLD